MKLIVGLGNPGPRYETTRHNAGFLAIDRLIERWQATGPQEKNHAELFQTSFKGEKILLIKPQTFMNRSGLSVGPLFQFHKCAPQDLIVLHDEVDLPSNQLRIKQGGGTGGHNGLKSLDQHIGNEFTDYYRIRIGVGKNVAMDTGDHVLQPFTDEELQGLDPLLDKIAEATELLIENRFKEAQNLYNRRES